MKHSLQPLDVAVALAFVGHQGLTYPEISRRLHISVSTAHAAVARLQWSGLALKLRGTLRVDASALEEFLVHGVRYAFPAQRGRLVRGVGTAHAAPALRNLLDAEADPVVWPSNAGSVIGTAITPLVASAPLIASEYPELYDLLALVDAIRIGSARDREIATSALADRLRFSAA